LDGAKKDPPMSDAEIIAAFVAHLRDLGYPGLQVDRRPDQENRDSTDIDAIAGPFAIEHTSIDTLPNQRRDSDWFIRAVGGVEQEVEGALPFRLSIAIEYDAVGRGQDWAAIRKSLTVWLINQTADLPDGRSLVTGLPGVPFRMHIVKSSGRLPGVFFARFQPEDETLSVRIRQAFERKAVKLRKYKRPGIITVLLLENDDRALMNNWKMLEAIRAAYPSGLPTGVDQVWYADTSIPSALEFRDFTSQLRDGAVQS
jgi:hypothetical protein